RFTLDDTGRLTTQAGQAVLDDGGGEIVVDPQKGPVQIAKDGTISQGAERIGKVGVVKFDTLSVLDKTGDNLFRNTSNTQPAADPTAVLRQGMLENSNVNTITQITHLLEVTRTYESMAKMMSDASDLSRQSVSRMGRVQ